MPPTVKEKNHYFFRSEELSLKNSDFKKWNVTPGWVWKNAKKVSKIIWMEPKHSTTTKKICFDWFYWFKKKLWIDLQTFLLLTWPQSSGMKSFANNHFALLSTLLFVLSTDARIFPSWSESFFLSESMLWKSL